MSKLRLALFVGLALSPSASARAADYYVSRAGDDANIGSSATAPWQSLARVNAVVLQPGDRRRHRSAI